MYPQTLMEHLMNTHARASENACLILPSPQGKEEGRDWHDDGQSRKMIEGLPEGYFYDDALQMICLSQAKGSLPICGPLQVAMRLSSPQRTTSAFLINFIDCDDQPRSAIIPASKLVQSAAEVIAQLSDHGLAVAGSSAQVARLLRQWRPQKSGLLATDRGWIVAGEQVGYVLPTGQIISSRATNAMPIMGLTGNSAPDVSGSFEGWHDGVAAAAKNNPLLMFSICCALAGPLLAPLGVEGGGFDLHGRTSSGKTTALYAAMSVYGAPQEMMRWQATSTGFETAARRAKDGVLIVDEIPTRDARVARDLTSILYMIANGTGKKRSNTQLEDLAPQAWATVLLTSSESPLTEIYAQSGLEIPEGLTVRLADVPAKSWRHGGFADLHGHSTGGAFADALKVASHQHYGHAGPRFIEKLITLRQGSGMSKLDALVAKLSGVLAEQLLEGTDMRLESPERRVIQRLAVVSLAGHLACSWNLVPWTAAEIRKAILEIAQLWLEQRRRLVMSPETAIMRQIGTYFHDHMCDFADIEAGEVFLVDQHAGWHDTEKIAIAPDVFADIVHPILAKSAAGHLQQIGVLSAGGEARSLQRRRSPTMDPERGREYWILKVPLFGHLQKS